MQSRTIGGYRIIATLGRGGMADVFLAVRSGLVGFTKLVVIKRLRSDLADVPDAARYRTLLLDEARLGARLGHPNIVQTYEVGSDEGEPYMVMEYLEGKPLNQVLMAAQAAKVKVPVDVALQVVADVLGALGYAHDLRDFDGAPLHIVHRDVSPHNIFWTYDGQIKLVDFGVAKSTYGTDETAAGVVKGKVTYMAPEQARAEAIDQRADIFAAGILLWELVANERLFRADNFAASLARLLTEPIPPLSSVVPDVDPAIERIASRALEPDLERRYGNASEMRADIARVLETSRPIRRDDLASFIKGLFDTERREVADRVRQAIASTSELTPDLTIAATPASISSRQIPETLHGAATTQAPSRSPRWGTRAALGGALLLGGAALVVGLRMKAHPQTGDVASASAVAQVPAPEPALRMCGSNTVGVGLAPAIVEAFLKKKGAANVRRTTHGETTSLVADLSGVALVVELTARGTATAFEGLAAGTCDVGMASRPINDKEASKLASAGLGDLRSPASEHVVALDGIAVVVNPNNTVRTLDRQALHDIFTGAVADWSAVGGTPGPIVVVARDKQSGTYDTFKNLALGSDDVAPAAKRFAQSDELSDAVASNPAAIGFIGLAYTRSARAVAVGEHGALPMLPTTFTVTTESYMLSRRLFFYSTAKPRTPLVAELVSFALSNDGQAAVRTTSFVDLSVALRDAPACDARCPRRYADLTSQARRVSLDFRFKPGTSDLDSRAARDLDRIVQFMRTQPDRQIALFGFSDGSGDAASNVRLSQARAQAVSRELAMRGVRVGAVEGFGAAMPVASSATDPDRERNRRVEVWLR